MCQTYIQKSNLQTLKVFYKKKAKLSFGLAQVITGYMKTKLILSQLNEPNPGLFNFLPNMEGKIIDLGQTYLVISNTQQYPLALNFFPSKK